MRIVLGVGNQTTGAGNVRERTVCAIGVELWVTLRERATVRQMVQLEVEKQVAGEVVVQGEEAEAEGARGLAKEKQMERLVSKDTLKC